MSDLPELPSEATPEQIWRFNAITDAQAIHNKSMETLNYWSNKARTDMWITQTLLSEFIKDYPNLGELTEKSAIGDVAGEGK